MAKKLHQKLNALNFKPILTIEFQTEYFLGKNMPQKSRNVNLDIFEIKAIGIFIYNFQKSIHLNFKQKEIMKKYPGKKKIFQKPINFKPFQTNHLNFQPKFWKNNPLRTKL